MKLIIRFHISCFDHIMSNIKIKLQNSRLEQNFSSLRTEEREEQIKYIIPLQFWVRKETSPSRQQELFGVDFLLSLFWRQLTSISMEIPILASFYLKTPPGYINDKTPNSLMFFPFLFILCIKMSFLEGEKICSFWILIQGSVKR